MKYHNQKTKLYGRTYHSKKEAEYALYLISEKNKGNIKKIDEQYPIKLEVNGKLLCKYICDFKIIDKNDKEKYIEVKGMWTPVAKLKFKLLKILFPDINIEVV